MIFLDTGHVNICVNGRKRVTHKFPRKGVRLYFEFANLVLQVNFEEITKFRNEVRVDVTDLKQKVFVGVKKIKLKENIYF